MASFKANKKRLTIDLSFFVPHDHNISSSTKSTTKSPKYFEPDDEVGLGIVAAMDELYQTLNPLSPAKSNRAAIFAVSPRSTTIPILNINNTSVSAKSRGGSGGGPKLEENMELSEEYTCVISHVGNNSIKKREYFDGNLANETESTNNCRVSSDHSGQFSACSPLPQSPKGSVVEAATQFCSAEFLNTCYLCKKRLHGLDIFMYRGEKAFCSTECRNKLISTDEHREKCGMQPVEYSVSPCSGQLQLFAGVAAA